MTQDHLDQRIQTVCLLLLATVAVGAALYWLRPVMIPFVLAVFFTLAMSPIVEVQIRVLRLPRPLAILSTVILAFAILALVGVLITTSALRMAANADLYQAQVAQLVEQTAEALPLERLGVDPDRALQLPVQSVTGVLLSTTNAIVELVSQGFLVMIYVFFLLAGSAAAAPGPVDGEEIADDSAWRQIELRIRRYISVHALLSAVTGVLVGTVLGLLGVELAMVFGLLAFLLNFIPSLGSIISTLLPLPVVLVSPEITTTTAILAIVIPGAIQFAIGNVVEPKIMGESLDLHPVTLLMALVVWGMLWGIVGMLLATPITAMMKILFERLELTAPIADVLAGRLDRLRGV